MYSHTSPMIVQGIAVTNQPNPQIRTATIWVPVGSFTSTVAVNRLAYELPGKGRDIIVEE